MGLAITAHLLFYSRVHPMRIRESSDKHGDVCKHEILCIHLVALRHERILQSKTKAGVTQPLHDRELHVFVHV